MADLTRVAMRAATHSRRFLELALWLIVLGLGLRFAYLAVDGARRSSHGFVAAYTASRLLLEGEDPAMFYDDAWFKQQVRRFEPAIADIYINPPPLAWLTLPLAPLPYRTARIVWTILNVVIAAATAVYLLRRLAFTGRERAAFIAIWLLYQPLLANFHLGQLYLVLLALLVLAWHGYREGNGRLLGIALGLLFAFKLAGLFLWLLLLLQRQWRALAWGVATILIVTLLSLPWLGVAAWQGHLETVLRSGSHPSQAVTAYQTIHSFFHHLFSYHDFWNPAPLLVAPALATWLARLAYLVLIGFSIRLALRPPPDLAWSAFVVLGVIVSPWALDYHYALLLLPMALVAARLRQQPRWWPWLLLAAAVYLTGADLPYRSPTVAGGFWALLAYPKLYGALLLWALGQWTVDK
jgi:hypothetical protein